VEGARPRARPKKTWRGIVQKDHQAHKLRMPWIVIDGGSRQGMIDDHDRCEWVNVSSGSGSPGCPVQNPDSCKTVVVAVVEHL